MDLPSGLIAMKLTKALCPSKVTAFWPVSTSHVENFDEFGLSSVIAAKSFRNRSPEVAQLQAG
jgi:hypothetical protein